MFSLSQASALAQKDRDRLIQCILTAANQHNHKIRDKLQELESMRSPNSLWSTQVMVEHFVAVQAQFDELIQQDVVFEKSVAEYH